MTASIVNTIFYGLFLIFVAYSLLTVYALLRFGRSKIVGIVVSLVFLVLTGMLYVTALVHINNILHP